MAVISKIEKFKKLLKERFASERLYNTLSKIVNSPIGLKLTFKMRYKPSMPDEDYIKELYYARFNKKINLENPVTFNEKNNWRKLHDRRDIYTSMVDKYKIKKIITEKLGADYTFPLLAAWDNPDDIDISNLPDKFVLKANHAGGVIVCRDKNNFDLKKAKRELKHQLEFNYFYFSREWPYKNVERRIICEQYMGENLTDYKNYVFNGKLMYTFVWQNESRIDGRKPQAFFCGAYDRNWNKSGIEIGYPSRDITVARPECHADLIRAAEVMTGGGGVENNNNAFPFARVDCYIINNHVYVGEMTFFPWGGFMNFKDDKWDVYLGGLEKLPDMQIN